VAFLSINTVLHSQALHRSRLRPTPYRVVVRPPLGRQDHLPKIARISTSRRNGIYRHGGCPHHRLAALPVLDRHATACIALCPSPAWDRCRRAVDQTAPDFRGCFSRRAARCGAGGLWVYRHADAPEQNTADVCLLPGPTSYAEPRDQQSRVS
jgi:hypothetical protein